jgi:hypothetical protein
MAPRFPPEGDLPPFTPIGFLSGFPVRRIFGWVDDGGPVDMTGGRVVFRAATAPPTELSSDPAGGIVILPQAGGTMGLFEVDFSADLVDALLAEPATPYTLHVEMDGELIPIGRGEINLFLGSAAA